MTITEADANKALEILYERLMLDEQHDPDIYTAGVVADTAGFSLLLLVHTDRTEDDLPKEVDKVPVTFWHVPAPELQSARRS